MFTVAEFLVAVDVVASLCFHVVGWRGQAQQRVQFYSNVMARLTTFLNVHDLPIDAHIYVACFCGFLESARASSQRWADFLLRVSIDAHAVQQVFNRFSPHGHNATGPIDFNFYRNQLTQILNDFQIELDLVELAEGLMQNQWEQAKPRFLELNIH
jgi:hypothetical protein